MGHPAANTLLALTELAKAEPGTRITWAVRGSSAARLYGGGDADGLPARGALGTRLKVHQRPHRRVFSVALILAALRRCPVGRRSARSRPASVEGSPARSGAVAVTVGR
ncbi:hypothetical protein GCM10023085_17260 [Actinomadura viridis]